MRGPVAELLIGGDAVSQHGLVDVGEIGFFGRRDVRRRGFVHVDPGFGVGADEGLGHIARQPVARRRQAGKPAGPDLPADLGDDVADAVGLQLLGKRPLLLDVLALAGAKGVIDILGPARIDGLDFGEIDARLVAGVFEHGQGLAAAEQHGLGAFQLVPAEIRIGLAPGEEKAVHLVDLGEVHRRRRLALAQRRKALAQGGLHDMRRAVLQRRDGRNAGRRHRPVRLQTFGLEKTA